MLIAFVFLLIFTSIFTWSVNDQDKKHKKWLEDAKKAYEENEFTYDYPRSEIFILENDYKYNMNGRFIFSAWVILLICPLFCELKTYIIIYLVNYMYSRILMWLSLIEQKIDTIKKEVYKENEGL